MNMLLPSSVAQGVFVFQNGAFIKRNDEITTQSKFNLFDYSPTDSTTWHKQRETWFRTYKNTWQLFKNRVDEFQSSKEIVHKLVHFILSPDQDKILGTIRTAALVTGVNNSDHTQILHCLSSKLRNHEKARVVNLDPIIHQTTKCYIQDLVHGFIQQNGELKRDKLDKKQMNLRHLEAWYNFSYIKEQISSLVVIIPNLEYFRKDILSDLILILHSYSQKLPFCLIFGIKTSVNTLHQRLLYKLSSKISLQIFQAKLMINRYDRLMRNIVTSSNINFNIFNITLMLSKEVFWYNEISSPGFLNGFKLNMIAYLSQGNMYALCTEALENYVHNLVDAELEQIRTLSSFRKFVGKQKSQKILALLEDGKYLKRKLLSLLSDVETYWSNFHGSLIVLCCMMNIFMPKKDNKHLMELYPVFLRRFFWKTKEFKDLTEIISTIEPFELPPLLKNVVAALEELESLPMIELFKRDLKLFLKDLKSFATHSQNEEFARNTENLMCTTRNMNYAEPTKKTDKSYSDAIRNILQEFLEPHLLPKSMAPPLYELYYTKNLKNIKVHINGIPRATVHHALAKPSSYLKLNQQENKNVINLPQLDVSIAFNLHLEHGKFINLYDWLQSFECIINDQESKKDVHHQSSILIQ